MSFHRYISLSHDPIELRHLLDDVGIEVKRVRQESNDTIYGLELLANRGDHYCYQGIARALHGRTGAALCGPQLRHLQRGNLRFHCDWKLKSALPIPPHY